MDASEKQLPASEINDSPLVTDDTVYLGDGTATLWALDRTTGDERFKVRLDPHPFARIYSSPVKVGDLIVIGV
jgi:outer membrane protein assembly factor BamB